LPNVTATAETEPPEMAVVFSTLNRRILDPAGKLKRFTADGEVVMAENGTLTDCVNRGKPVFTPAP